MCHNVFHFRLIPISILILSLHFSFNLCCIIAGNPWQSNLQEHKLAVSAMSLTWYISVNPFLSLNYCLKYAYGYLWNALGWWPYPSHGRTTHWTNQPWKPRLDFYWEAYIWVSILLPLLSLSWVTYLSMFTFSGEFTMIELAETVKEVSFMLFSLLVAFTSPSLVYTIVFILSCE